MDGIDQDGRDHSDRGVTLIEVLVALSILSIAAVAILAGVEMSIRTSDMHRKQSTGGALVRNYAEAIQQYVAKATNNYDECSGGVDYSFAKVGFPKPPKYTPGYRDVVPLDGDGAQLLCGQDKGVQRITVTMESDDQRASEELTIVLRKACAPGGDPC